MAIFIWYIIHIPPKLLRIVLLFQLSLTERETAKETLKTWVGGFSKNSGGNPYLLEECLRVVLFPEVPVSAVVPLSKAQPVLDRIKNAVAKLGEGLQVLDINLDEVADIEGRRDQVSEVDPLDVSLPTDQVNVLLESEVSNLTSFSGFEGAPASAQEKVPQQQTKSASSSCKKNQHSASRKHQKDSRSSKATRKSPKGGSKKVAKPRASDSHTEERTPSQEPQPGPSSAPQVAPSPVASPQLDMPALVSAIMQLL